jgi:hypothetical protein
VVIASQSGHRLGALSAEQDKALATTAPEQLLSLPFLQPEQVKDSLHAYQLAKRGNSLRVMAEAVRWAILSRPKDVGPGAVAVRGPLHGERIDLSAQPNMVMLFGTFPTACRCCDTSIPLTVRRKSLVP